MTRLLRRAALLVSLTGAFLATSGDALANHFCNDTIASPGVQRTLTHDHTCPAGTAITIDADNVTLDLGGFTVSGQGTGSVGIDVGSLGDDVYILNGTVRGFDTGIQADGSCISGVRNLIIEFVTVRNSSSYGMNLCTLDSAAVRSSAVLGTDLAGTGIMAVGPITISQSRVRDGGIGIELFESSHTGQGDHYVLGSRVENAALRGIYIFGGNDYNEISDSTITGCPSGNCRTDVGIDLTTSLKDFAILRTTITNMDSIGIRAHGMGIDTPSFTIEDTVVSSISDPLLVSSADAGIVIKDYFGGRITGTTVRNVEAPGIHIVCSQAVAVEDSVVMNVEGDGIVLDDVPEPPLASPCVFSSHADVVARNLVRGAGGNGIVVASGLDHQLTGNTVLGSGLDGFSLGSGATGLLTDNRALRNGDDGFQLDTAALTLTGNRARRNSGWGFLTVAPVTDLGGNQANNNTLGDCDPLHLAC